MAKTEPLRLSPQQYIALARPCVHPEECSQQRFRAAKRLGAGPWWLSVLLTVNVGEE